MNGSHYFGWITNRIHHDDGTIEVRLRSHDDGTITIRGEKLPRCLTKPPLDTRVTLLFEEEPR